MCHLVVFVILNVSLLLGINAQNIVVNDIKIGNTNHTYKLQGKLVVFNQLGDAANVAYFGSIPYAKPPVGFLRYRPPRELNHSPAGYTSTVYNTDRVPNSCWHGGPYYEFDKKNPAANMWFTKANMSEDCLYLTIWAPYKPRKLFNESKLPVMVWVYGGSYMNGASSLEVYDATALVATQNVIVVSLQFRMGPLGFLYMGKNLKGNQALLDQQMALRWVRNNIGKFGGDNKRVTLFGESSGATSISIHMFAKGSQDLFKRVILQSGTLLAPWAIENEKEALKKSYYFVKESNCTSDWSNPLTAPSSSQTRKIIRCLQKLSPDKILANGYEIRNLIAYQRAKTLRKQGRKNLNSDAAIFFDIYFRPVFSDEFITEKQMESIKANNISTKKEILLGTNSNEGIFFLLYGLSGSFPKLTSGKDPILPVSSKVDTFTLMRENMLDYNYLQAGKSLANLVMYRYKINKQDNSSFIYNNQSVVNIFSKLDRMAGDAQFICSTQKFADSMSRYTKVYMYVFDIRTKALPVPKWFGVMHGYEIEYVFGTPFNQQFAKRFYTFNNVEKEASQRIMKLWANFAKTGDPTQYGMGKNFYWPLYSANKKEYVKLKKTNQKVEQNFKQRDCLFWNEILPDIRNSIVRKAGEKVSLNKNACLVLLTISVTLIFS